MCDDDMVWSGPVRRHMYDGDEVSSGPVRRHTCGSEAKVWSGPVRRRRHRVEARKVCGGPVRARRTCGVANDVVDERRSEFSWARCGA